MINRRTATLAFGVLSTGWVASGLAGCGETLPGVLKIGVLVPQTGPHAIRGVDLLRGATMARDEINAAGIKIGEHSMTVEIVGFDDQGEVDRAVIGANELVNAGVLGVIGPLNTPQAVKVIPVLAEAGRPNLFTATATNLHAMGRGNTFRLLANDELQGRAVASFMHDSLKAERIAVLYEPTDYGRGLDKTLTDKLTALKNQVVIDSEIDAKGAVSAAIAARLKAENVDVVALLARDTHLKGLYAALQSVNHTKVTVVGTNTIRNRNVATEAIPVSRLYATATAIDAQEFSNGVAFVRAFEKVFKQPPVWGAHYAYDAVYALVGAVRSAKSVMPQKVITMLKTRDPQARVNGQMRFTTEGEQHHAAVAVYRADGGRWELQMRSSQW